MRLDRSRCGEHRRRQLDCRRDPPQVELGYSCLSAHICASQVVVLITSPDTVTVSTQESGTISSS